MKRVNISLLLIFLLSLVGAESAWSIGRKTTVGTSNLASRYMDSLMIYRDSLFAASEVLSSDDQTLALSAQNFMPLTSRTFYPQLIHDAFSSDESDALDLPYDPNYLTTLYLRRPDLMRYTYEQLKREGEVDGSNAEATEQPEAAVIPSATQAVVSGLASTVVEPDAQPVEVVVEKPNFWTKSADTYLQFLQNFVTGNWYKGGESNYSMVSSVTLQANYNNKQKVKWDNKLELKLGVQTTRDDTVHRYKTSEDLIRYTGKLGLQATKRWYYTFQTIAYTQFLRGYKSNDFFCYSDIFSPFNLNLSIGMDYTVEWWKKKLTGTIHLAPFAYNMKYVDRLALSTRYGIDEGKHTLHDFGSQFTIDLTWKPADNISWKTRMYGYTTYSRFEFEWENTISFQFNKYITANLFLYPRFDDNTKRDSRYNYWQFKEYSSLGFSYSF